MGEVAGGVSKFTACVDLTSTLRRLLWLTVAVFCVLVCAYWFFITPKKRAKSTNVLSKNLTFSAYVLLTGLRLVDMMVCVKFVL